jgi:hypothetical protein
VDKHVKKLKGKDVCLLVLYAMFQGKTTNLRTLETYYGSSVFQTYADIRQGSQIAHSSIADRLTRLQAGLCQSPIQPCTTIIITPLFVSPQTIPLAH